MFNSLDKIISSLSKYTSTETERDDYDEEDEEDDYDEDDDD